VYEVQRGKGMGLLLLFERDVGASNLAYPINRKDSENSTVLGSLYDMLILFINSFVNSDMPSSVSDVGGYILCMITTTLSSRIEQPSKT
jgi:hypothetical protein